MNISETIQALLMASQKLYIDPSAVTIAVSSISGILIAAGATAAIWWTRAKKKAAKAFHIDPNANKEVEEELVVKSEENDGTQTSGGEETDGKNND